MREVPVAKPVFETAKETTGAELPRLVITASMGCDEIVTSARVRIADKNLKTYTLDDGDIVVVGPEDSGQDDRGDSLDPRLDCVQRCDV